ncbi:peptidoglycan recognition protein family protein [Psychroflexus aestuariivivens]|uniref:peptidoglycan recognition protein family protein n=1 Tax=Psychroflexus aestuariivivens TaxID=1795040 RepID=UPI000FDA9E4C|nr:peptidoglycan recognition family protein [Psychroflexus aestuariivivens]
MRATQIKYIVIHCTAGFKNAEAVQDYFTRPKSKGGRGWRTGGYNRIVEEDGTIKKMYPFSRITNGVLGYNAESLHISYVGGLNYEEFKEGNFIAEDTRTDAQKIAIEQCIIEAIEWLQENGKDIYHDLMILGHRDFSNDKDGSGVIESWERIKECPCFDAIPEYKFYNSNNGKKELLPTNR